MSVVLDASALLALFRREPGAALSTVNLAEVLTRVIREKGSGQGALRIVSGLGLTIDTPELEYLSGKQAASLVGLAPMSRQS